MHTSPPRLALLAPLLAFLVASPMAAQHAHEGATHTLTLNDGKRWDTDAPLRQGMSAIRDAVAADHRAIHAGTESADAYRALAGRIEAQIAEIVTRCKLSPAADAQFHVILSDLVAGATQMKDADAAQRRAGAGRIVAALDAYPRYFDHPGWRPLD